MKFLMARSDESSLKESVANLAARHTLDREAKPKVVAMQRGR